MDQIRVIALYRPARLALLALSALGVAAPLNSALPAATISHVTDYSITLSGLSLAKASFRTEIAGKDFQIQGQFKTTGLARLFRKVEGTANVSGKLKGDNFVAESYRSDYVAGTAHKVYQVSFAGGGVKSFQAEPPLNPPANWVPVTPADIARAVDPLSGLILPADTNPCAATIPVFDGEARTDFQLTDKGVKTYSNGREKLEAHVCGFRIGLKAGYRKGKSDMEYVAKLKDMEIWFAKSPVADVYAPVKILVPTGFGSVEIAATRFGA
ncbi:hypothetical protein ABID16_004275 [Rhizobium aquaticum]|uniref:DUF3108 domain-containing protein n=1 Tax=Rhizobium aquaticum TaxID=1549636 RepID=A0ABV2J586_9HYPH